MEEIKVQLYSRHMEGVKGDDEAHVLGPVVLFLTPKDYSEFKAAMGFLNQMGTSDIKWSVSGEVWEPETTEIVYVTLSCRRFREFDDHLTIRLSTYAQYQVFNFAMQFVAADRPPGFLGIDWLRLKATDE